MGLNIKNKEVERLVSRISQATGETKTETIRRALEERAERLALPDVEDRLAQFIAARESILRGRRFPPVTKEEREALYGI